MSKIIVKETIHNLKEVEIDFPFFYNIYSGEYGVPLIYGMITATDHICIKQSQIDSSWDVSKSHSRNTPPEDWSYYLKNSTADSKDEFKYALTQLIEFVRNI